jgi:hypothetical protein
MKMNPSSQTEALHEAAASYIESIAVPTYRANAVQARLQALSESRATWRPAAAALAAAGVVVVLIFNGPAVIAQVERALQAFATIDGRTVTVAVNTVTLDQARHDMPFEVIAPAGIPAQFQVTIHELNFGSSRFDSHLLFEYRTSGNAPPLTIAESSTRANAPQRTHLMIRQGANAGAMPAAPALPAAGSGGYGFVQFKNGQTIQRIRLEPIDWTVRGTRIQLISPPGLLSNAALTAIRRAMSH